MAFAAGLPLATQGYQIFHEARVAVGNQAFTARISAGNQSFAVRIAAGNQGFSARVAEGTQAFVIKSCCRRPCSLYLSAFRESHTV